MADTLTYTGRCPKGHLISLTFNPRVLAEQLAEGEATLYCVTCDVARPPSAAQRQELAALVASDPQD